MLTLEGNPNRAREDPEKVAKLQRRNNPSNQMECGIWSLPWHREETAK